MGCGESKQAVATENTLTKSKSKAKNSENTNNLPVEKPTDDETNVDNNANGDVKENEKVPLIGKGNEDSTEDGKEEEVVDHGDVAEEKADKAVVSVEENVVVVSNVITPKKDDDNETIDSLISEGISGKSDYYSPHSKGHLSEGSDGEEKEKDEVLKVEEEVSSASSDEPQSSGEEKISAAENETKNAESTTEVKAN